MVLVKMPVLKFMQFSLGGQKMRTRWFICKVVSNSVSLILPIAISMISGFWIFLPINAAADTAFETRFERSDGTETVSYEEGITYYQRLAEAFNTVNIQTVGMTDAGEPLHLVLYSNDRDFDISSNRKKDRTILLINNAIHAGETDGVDASMLLLRDIAKGKMLKKEMRKVLLAIIPFYNIGGVLNRNQNTRVNQNGPKEYGFRGNARNYDLNRDFIKSDSRNMRAFAEIFHYLDPDILIDTHVSNGADYQYVITLDYPQKDKLGGALGTYLENRMLPDLYLKMRRTDFEMTPYVNVWGKTPEQGWTQFMDWPRYSSGYAALFQTIGFMVESHMLKPYKTRVKGTYIFMESVIRHMAGHGMRLKASRDADKVAVKTQEAFALSWKPDMENPSKINFKGYAGRMLPSHVTTGERLFYDRSQPYEKKTQYYDNYSVEFKVKKPKAYILPKGWWNIAELMSLNGVQVEMLDQAIDVLVEVYYIKNYKTAAQPYEGHYPHSELEVEIKKQKLKFSKGDFLISVNQVSNRYIVETLEPQAPDSFFAWNFFDTHLQRKEYFSAYVFEDIAERLLKEDENLKRRYDEKLKSDKAFSEDTDQQLSFIYENSPYHEREYMRYPVFRVVAD